MRWRRGTWTCRVHRHNRDVKERSRHTPCAVRPRWSSCFRVVERSRDHSSRATAGLPPCHGSRETFGHRLGGVGRRVATRVATSMIVDPGGVQAISPGSRSAPGETNRVSRYRFVGPPWRPRRGRSAVGLRPLGGRLVGCARRPVVASPKLRNHRLMAPIPPGWPAPNIDDFRSGVTSRL